MIGTLMDDVSDCWRFSASFNFSIFSQSRPVVNRRPIVQQFFPLGFVVKKLAPHEQKERPATWTQAG